MPEYCNIIFQKCLFGQDHICFKSLFILFLYFDYNIRISKCSLKVPLTSAISLDKRNPNPTNPSSEQGAKVNSENTSIIQSKTTSANQLIPFSSCQHPSTTKSTNSKDLLSNRYNPWKSTHHPINNQIFIDLNKLS